MRIIQAIIIDDEQNLRNGLKALLKKYCKDVEVVGEADSVKSALALLKEKSPDLIFLDIQLSDGTGFDILEQITNEDNENFKTNIVFTTAHEQYALKAFKFSALDYLLKPIDPEDLINAVGKINTNTTLEDIANPLEVLLENLRSSNSNSKRIALSTSDGIHVFNVAEIIRCESLDNYTRFYIQNHKPLMVSKTLKEYEELLSPQGFERVHQSHLINLSHLKSFIKSDGGYVLMDDGSHITVSQRKREKLMQALKSM